MGERLTVLQTFIEFHLLRPRCHPIAAGVGVPRGSILILHGEPGGLWIASVREGPEKWVSTLLECLREPCSVALTNSLRINRGQFHLRKGRKCPVCATMKALN